MFNHILIYCNFNFQMEYFPFVYSFSTSPLFYLTMFHLNISFDCLAAPAACFVSPTFQGPTFKWSTAVTFKGMCVRNRDTEREKDGVGKSETSGGDENWKGGEDNGVITNVLPVYFLSAPVKSSCSQQHLLSRRLKDKADVFNACESEVIWCEMHESWPPHECEDKVMADVDCERETDRSVLWKRRSKAFT